MREAPPTTMNPSQFTCPRRHMLVALRKHDDSSLGAEVIREIDAQLTQFYPPSSMLMLV